MGQPQSTSYTLLIHGALALATVALLPTLAVGDDEMFPSDTDPEMSGRLLHRGGAVAEGVAGAAALNKAWELPDDEISVTDTLMKARQDALKNAQEALTRAQNAAHANPTAETRAALESATQAEALARARVSALSVELYEHFNGPKEILTRHLEGRVELSSGELSKLRSTLGPSRAFRVLGTLGGSALLYDAWLRLHLLNENRDPGYAPAGSILLDRVRSLAPSQSEPRTSLSDGPEATGKESKSSDELRAELVRHRARMQETANEIRKIGRNIQRHENDRPGYDRSTALANLNQQLALLQERLRQEEREDAQIRERLEQAKQAEYERVQDALEGQQGDGDSHAPSVSEREHSADKGRERSGNHKKSKHAESHEGSEQVHSVD